MDIKKLNKVINDIEVTTSDIKKYNESYNKIVDIIGIVEDLANNIQSSNIAFNDFQKDNVSHLQNINENLLSTGTKLIKNSDKNIQENTALLNNIHKDLKFIMQEFNKNIMDDVSAFSNSLEERFKNYNDKLSKINSDINNSTKKWK